MGDRAEVFGSFSEEYINKELDWKLSSCGSNGSPYRMPVTGIGLTSGTLLAPGSSILAGSTHPGICVVNDFCNIELIIFPIRYFQAVMQ